MNYLKHYNKLIERARNRKLDCYKERHHIIPRCLGGSNDQSNLADLTGREHFIAHLLLVKIYPKEPGLVCAAWMMSCKGRGQEGRINNKRYEWLKKKMAREKSILYTGRKYSEATKLKISKAKKGKKFTEEHKAKLSKSHLGKKTY